jgi:hypothetical protein
MSSLHASRPLSDQAILEIDRETRDQGANVRRFGEPLAVATASVSVRPDVTMLHFSDHRSEAVPTASLRTISVVRRGQGALEGLGLGTLGGAITGGLAFGLAGALAIDSCNASLKDEGLPCGAGLGFAIGSIIGALGGAVIGAIVGPIIGVAEGHRVDVEFDDASPPSS